MSFKNEFNANKTLKKEFDKSYRNLSAKMDSFLKNENEQGFLNIYTIVKQKEKLVSQIASEIKEKLEIPLYAFLSSHIHMTINRQFTSRQRQYEC